jgi:hypothetical protein
VAQDEVFILILVPEFYHIQSPVGYHVLSMVVSLSICLDDMKESSPEHTATVIED